MCYAHVKHTTELWPTAFSVTGPHYTYHSLRVHVNAQFIRGIRAQIAQKTVEKKFADYDESVIIK